MALFSSLNAAINATPRHHGSVLAQSAFQYLVPANDALAILLQHLLNAFDHVALQLLFSRVLVVGLQVLVGNAFLAGGASFPTGLGALVATNVEVFAGEQRYHFLKDVVEEVEHQFFARAHHNIFNAPYGAQRPLFALARQFGIGRDGCHHVARQVNLRYHGYIALGGIAYDVFNLLLCVETTIVRSVALFAYAANRGELRIFLYLDAPALVFGQVKVHGVYLQRCHQVKLLLHVLYRDKVAAGVEVEATIAKAWIVVDVAALCHPFYAFHHVGALYLGGQQL